MTRKGMFGATLALAILPFIPRTAAAAPITRIPTSDGGQPNGFSSRPAVSANGRFVVFESSATNMVPNDTNNRTDIFLYDAQDGSVRRVSVASDGAQADGHSFYPSISADGRYVAFESNATNLVNGDTNKTWDVFVHDNQTGATQRVSVSSDGTQADGTSNHAAISADGKYVAFESVATNLVADDTNGVLDVFVRALDTGQTVRVSVSSGGDQGNHSSGYLPAISGDGRYVVFWSLATNLVPGATNGKSNIFVRDTLTNTTTVASAPAGEQSNGDSSNPTISANGAYTAFYSDATNLVANDADAGGDIFLANRQTGVITRVGPAGDPFDWIFGTLRPAMSPDGGLVAFTSDIANVVPGKSNGDLQVYLYNHQSGTTELISATPGGAPGTGHSYVPAISAEGRWIAFASEATDLVPNDTNNAGDIFLAQLAPPAGFTLADVGDALRIAGGLSAASSTDPARLGGGPITVASAVHIARKVAGLEPNP